MCSQVYTTDNEGQNSIIAFFRFISVGACMRRLYKISQNVYMLRVRLQRTIYESAIICTCQVTWEIVVCTCTMYMLVQVHQFSEF